jgi:hypothetical protein
MAPHILNCSTTWRRVMSFTQGTHCTVWVTPDPVWTTVEKRQISLIGASPLCVVIMYQFITVNDTAYINQQN